MIKILLLSLSILLLGCASTETTEIAATEASTLAKLKETAVSVDVIDVTNIKLCVRCNRSSEIYWHAKYIDNKGETKGIYQPIPVKDWKAFVSKALNSDSNSNNKVKVSIKAISLKSVNEAYEITVELNTYVNSEKHYGKSIIKLMAKGHTLTASGNLTLDDSVIENIGLAIKEAYIESMK